MIALLADQEGSTWSQWPDYAIRLFGQMLVAVAAYLLYLRTKATERQASTAERGLIIDRYNRAVEQLESGNRATTMAAISTLEYVAKENLQESRAIIDLLATYVRLYSSLKNQQENPNILSPGSTQPQLEDVQAILFVIGRRTQWWPSQLDNETPINLTSCDLTGYSLRGCDLAGVDFTDSVFSETDLQNANLQGTTGLEQAQLKQATCDETTKMPHGLQACIAE